ncbi:hypothetical protein SEMRO_452_G145800.1 [Seminavis robusta]|uniref:Uncharacterized protein n=1 Tax=Seminavis robusta TaxID=568900 RepID=A0A9N8E1G6_9STRA|nr:hypothetical protein SEMRO_452_G145800.1 [Seminavis robusta]|eukprot:Sro452_g145800.1 n/a (169) ;mRNA; r:7673-8179
MSRPKPKYIPFTNEEMICSIFVGTTKDEPAIGTVVNNTKILSEETQLKLQDSIDEALYGADKDATFCVTLGSNIVWPKEAFWDFVLFLDNHGDVKRITCVSNSCIVLLTDKSFTITLLISGNNFDISPPKEKTKIRDSIDSFEVEVGLTQEVARLTPFKATRSSKRGR